MRHDKFIEDIIASNKSKLNLFKDLVIKYNETINLISRKKHNIDDIFNRHIIDSIQLVKYLIPDFDSVKNDIDQHISNITIRKKIIDLGSGGGFPGIIIALIFPCDITLVESNYKKSVFLSKAKTLLDHNMSSISIINDRIENIGKGGKDNNILSYDYCISRAFASLKKILFLTKNFNIQSKYILHKGQTYQDEINEALTFFSFNYNVSPSIFNLNDGGVILEIPSKYKESLRQ
ncbi:MAG TPA: 16S rRNA (guanine(527)-N(7))-methyltransferase RsmG [Candidatus Megaira endosymbiont of Hartmannula sinica]|nr:16S rRNA (guanine(527)-N(7))-methyltransferase RsmG [Candidatus Megaera endosymbiont of Hartmannula sinica]